MHISLFLSQIEKKKKKVPVVCKLSQQVIQYYSATIWRTVRYMFFLSCGALVKSSLGEMMYPSTWNIHQNVQKRIPQLTTH